MYVIAIPIGLNNGIGNKETKRLEESFRIPRLRKM